MEELNDKFFYVYSSSISEKVQIKIGTLEGKRQKPEYDKLLADPLLKYSGLYQEGCSDLIVVCQVFDQNHPLSLPVTTSYKAFSSRWNWNEWLTLPVQFNDLPRTAQLALTIYDCYGPNRLGPVGGTTISLFSKYGLFRQGMLDLRVWPNREADGNMPTTTPGKAKDHGKMQRLAKLAKKHRNGHITKVDWLDRLTFRELELINEKEKRSSDYLYLMIEFPKMCVDNVPNYIVYFEQNGEDIVSFRSQTDLVTVPDQEILKENLVESKHHKLARSLRSGHCDKDAKPNAITRDALKQIVTYPSTKHLSNEEQDNVWKYRFYLSTQKKALAKFLKCVNWNQHNEVRQALHMMDIWSPMDVEDALELLSSNFTHPAVRRYAVTRLQQAPDEEIMLYLLQLVQALKYENFKTIQEALYFQDLASFLIHRASKNFTLANYFYWYLLIECEDQTMNIFFSQRCPQFILPFSGSDNMQKKRHILTRQQKFIDKLVKLMRTVARESGSRKKKADKLQQLLADADSFKFNFSKFDAMPFPLDPDVMICGIMPEKASLFKSALMPSKLYFKTMDGKEYVAIFKLGDDLRQDQLIMQMIQLMDRLLSKENLDLKLTPYKVLATSTKHGFVQFIESVTVADVLASEGSILNYFRKRHPQENGPYGIAPDIMDTYVRSCAGYCVITYLLGVGDRHLDNLLLTEDGKLFHIDFGYILGRDPKPLPPPMKLSKEMVEAMGGVTSEHYQEFRKLCYTAFSHLRRHANLILNLFSLMVDASVPDIALEPDKAVRKVQDKLRLDLSEEEAVQYIQNLIETSVTAVMPAIVEQLHKITQYIRK
nr:unnamed protein product [Callosobruchus analis]